MTPNLLFAALSTAMPLLNKLRNFGLSRVKQTIIAHLGISPADGGQTSGWSGGPDGTNQEFFLEFFHCVVYQPASLA
jgi:hypothetical protein